MGDEVRGQLLLADRVVSGRVVVEDGLIAGVDVDDDTAAPASLPFITPGFVDVHVHGWGGHDAMGGAEALDGMARALLRRGVTSFLPTGYTQPWPAIVAFADTARTWIPRAPAAGAR